VTFLVLALFVTMHGGVWTSLAGVRLSMRSAWRLVAWAAALIAVRHLIVRDPRIDRWITSDIGHAAQDAGPLALDAPVHNADDRFAGRGRRVRRAAGRAALVVAIYAGLTALMTYPQVRELGTGVSLDRGDPLFSTWRLAWIAHQLPRHPARLFDANIFFPEQGTLAYSDSMIVPSVIAAPMLWLGVHQLVTYNIVFLAAFALSGAAMFLLVHSLTRHDGAAFAAGFVFAFLPYRFMHYAHLELQMAFWMPLCLWAFHRTARDGRLRDGLLTGLFLALQTLSSWYYGIFLITYLLVVGPVLLIGEGRRPARQLLQPLALGALLAAVLVLPMARPYFAARQTVGERPVGEIEFYSATPMNYLAAHPRNATFGPITAKLGAQERELFQGIAVPLIALIALWPPLSAARIAYVLGLLLALEISLGFNGVLYSWLHAYLFPFRGLRVPARMAMLVGHSLAILCGFGVARLARLPRRRLAASAVPFAAAALIFLEYRTTLELATVWKRPPAVYDLLPANQNSVVLNLPIVRPDIAYEPVYMYFSTFKWHTLVNGYSGFSPASYQELVDKMESFPDALSLAELYRRGVGYVIVHGAFVDPKHYEPLLARMDACSALERIGSSWWEGRESRLYRLRSRQ